MQKVRSVCVLEYTYSMLGGLKMMKNSGKCFLAYKLELYVAKKMKEIEDWVGKWY